MSSKAIPERRPIGDAFMGFVLQAEAGAILATEPQPKTEIIAQGQFVVRYGLRFLGKLHVSIVPGIVVLDYGDMITGEEAWDFLLKHSNLYPRSEVVGYRNDGTDDIITIKTLDMIVAPEVLVYADNTAIVPIARPAVLISSVTDDLPARLLEYIPHHLTIADWQTSAQHE